MQRFVQVLGPAADGGGMALDTSKLKQMLCGEMTSGLPVVVLAAVGPRGSGRTALLSAVQRTITEAQQDLLGPWPQPADPARAACEADRPGSAGAAVWPEMLPVTLPSGERAALLLLDAWGPFDGDCPAHQRASVLLFSALISSTLVVQTSAASPVLPLDDLTLLAKLGTAVQDVRHCTALQDLVLLMRDWGGPAPAGRQVDFAPLRDWAQREQAAGQVLQMMTEAADWYGEGDVLLFLVPEGPAAVSSASADPVALLAAPRPAKRFDTMDVRAEELAIYLDHLAAALTTTQCDAASLLQALVEANQLMAARVVKPVYEEKMKQLGSQWQQGAVSEQELLGAHTRAAHDALMAFKMARKMDGENVDGDKVTTELQRWLEEQYACKQKTMVKDTKELKAQAHEQSVLCKQSYESWMQDALNESPLMTVAELIKTHNKCRLEALSAFDENQGSSRHSLTQQRLELSDELEGLFRKFATKLDDAKEEAEVAEAEKSRITSAEKSAEQLYRSIMEAVQPGKHHVIHERVQECAMLQFDSKTRGFSEEQKAAARERLQANVAQTLRDVCNQANRDVRSAPITPRSGGQPGHKYDARGAGYGDRGAGYGDRGVGYGDRGTGYSDRGAGYADRGAGYGGQVSGYSGRGAGYGGHGAGYGEGAGGAAYSGTGPSYGNPKPGYPVQLQYEGAAQMGHEALSYERKSDKKERWFPRFFS